MQCVVFQKGIRSVQWDLGQSSRKLGNFREFLCKLQKKIGAAGCTSCYTNNFVGGSAAPPALPVPAPMYAEALF